MKNLIILPIVLLVGLLMLNHFHKSNTGCALKECGLPEKIAYACKETPKGSEQDIIKSSDAHEDEWSELTISNDKEAAAKIDGADEFSDFKKANDLISSPVPENSDSQQVKTGTIWLSSNMIWVYISITATILAGIMLTFPVTRNFRNFFLLGSVIVFGFYKGGCACPIMGVYELAIWLHGGDAKLHSLYWFMGIVVASYFTGKVYCGWICHLGAIQEYIYLGNRFPVLKRATAQRVLKIMQVTSFVGFITYAFLTKTNLFCKIEPFLVVFNLFSATKTGWILFGILIISTVLIYRPFCRGFCPLGLILGWVSLVPGARKIVKDDTCIGCSSCSEVCGHQAIKRTVVDEEEGIYDVKFIPEMCNACGDCMDVCGKDSISFCSKSLEVSDLEVSDE